MGTKKKKKKNERNNSRSTITIDFSQDITKSGPNLGRQSRALCGAVFALSIAYSTLLN